MERERFFKLLGDLVPSRDEVFREVQRLIERKAINLDDFSEENGYEDLFPLMGAILEKQAEYFISGSVYSNKRRKTRQKANQIKLYL